MVDMDKMRPSALDNISDWSDMLADIEQASGIEFSDWEQEFIESVEGQLSEGRTLTPVQQEKLREIWDKT